MHPAQLLLRVYGRFEIQPLAALIPQSTDRSVVLLLCSHAVTLQTSQMQMTVSPSPLQARPVPNYSEPFLPEHSAPKFTEGKSPAFCTRSRAKRC